MAKEFEPLEHIGMFAEVLDLFINRDDSQLVFQILTEGKRRFAKLTKRSVVDLAKWIAEHDEIPAGCSLLFVKKSVLKRKTLDKVIVTAWLNAKDARTIIDINTP